MEGVASRSIELLPPDVANQIAAGEVVERPASVVKELVENALDAGAHTVTVSVDGGGIAKIAVTDDGTGMSSRDAERAVLRHATSKIRDASDLFGVTTYGFRGEALPSIASVSKLRIATRTREADEGTEVVVDAGGDARSKPIGCAVGTTVSVDDLFFNTPARRKFLRTPQTEGSACVDLVMRLALPRPTVRFVVRRDGKPVRELLRHDTAIERARGVFSDEALAELRGERGQMRVTALLGPPERARSGAAMLALYVNGRNVRDKLLLRAVSQAYGSTLEGGRYPVGAVFLEVPPSEVDVNVHPQKSEVRFAAQSEVFSAIASILRDQLAGAPWARAAASFTDPWVTQFTGGPVHSPPAPDSQLFSARPIGAFVTPNEEPDPWGLAPRPPYPPVPYGTRDPEPGEPPLEARTGELLPQGAFAALRYIGQLRRMFLVCEGESGMVILDQHAAAERVTYQRLRTAYSSRTVAMQPLLVPESLEVTAHETALVEEQAAALGEMGFDIAVRGPTTVAIRGVPAVMVRADPRRLARDVIAELAKQGANFSRAVDLVLATMACHGSVRAGDDLSDEEARALLCAMDEAEFAGHCPHGRPIVWSMRWSELERRVGR